MRGRRTKGGDGHDSMKAFAFLRLTLKSYIILSAPNSGKYNILAYHGHAGTRGSTVVRGVYHFSWPSLRGRSRRSGDRLRSFAEDFGGLESCSSKRRPAGRKWHGKGLWHPKTLGLPSRQATEPMGGFRSQLWARGCEVWLVGCI